MRKREIERKFDQIVDFSEVEKFIDTPVKHFSSGMYLRLAFAVAAHLDPEILLVDEVLAVGDATFQQKCLGKMEDVAHMGRTVLFVSHNLAAVEHLCQKGIVLQDGRVTFNGMARDAIRYYLHEVGSVSTARSHLVDLTTVARRQVDYRPLLRQMELFTANRQPVIRGLRIGAPLTVHVRFNLESPTESFNVGLGFDNLMGTRIFTAHSLFQPKLGNGARVGEQTMICEIPSLTLVPGEYRIRVTLDIGNISVDQIEDATRLTIIDSDYYGTGKVPWNGTFVLAHNWRLVSGDSRGA
jgi:lipopolysaccharide transport system ATP-binding protein